VLTLGEAKLALQATMKRRTVLAAILAAVPAGLLAIRPAFAEVPAAKTVVDVAKERGLVGEQADGYLGFVVSTQNAALQLAVAEINEGRAALYAEVAARYGVDPAVVGRTAFEQRFGSIPRGEHYRDTAGVWRVK
jgi:hypothetical protein